MISSTPSKQTVFIVDLGIQNILSVENAFRTIGADVRIVTTPSEIDSAQFHPEKSQDPGLKLLHAVLHTLK